MEHRKGETLTFVCAPETEEHPKKAVELIYRGRSTEYVFEHTRIESFLDQIEDDARSAAFFAPLKARVSGTLPPPGEYTLHVAAGATKLGKRVREADRILDAIEAWIRRQAPTLEINSSSPFTAPRHCVRETPPGVPFEVTLRRWPSRTNDSSDSTFEIWMPVCLSELQEQTKMRMRRALATKCPKLHEARSTERTSVLVLELDDMALGSYTAIGDALIAELPRWQEQIPNEVYLVRTEISHRWQIWVLKDGTHWFPNVADAGPHYSDPDQIMHS